MMGFSDDLIVYGNEESNIVLFQVTGDHELDLLEKEYEMIRKAVSADFCLTCLRVGDWNYYGQSISGIKQFLDESFGYYDENGD